MRTVVKALLLAAMLFLPQAAQAGTACTIVVDFKTSAIVHEEGDCKTRRAAQSTFKLPLALMGFDSGILKDAHNPVWPYDPDYETSRDVERHDTDPARWEKESIVWFSQQLTQKLGKKKFQNYVDVMEYGNRDLSGAPGKDNGLTHAWLSSSLKISPVEQVSFIRSVLKQSFPLSQDAYDKFMTVVPEFTAGDWTVYGKTGTGYTRGDDGSLDKNSVEGWFVGWAVENDKKMAFASFTIGPPQEGSFAGPRTRDEFLNKLPAIMTADAHRKH